MTTESGGKRKAPSIVFAAGSEASNRRCLAVGGGRGCNRSLKLKAMLMGPRSITNHLFLFIATGAGLGLQPAIVQCRFAPAQMDQLPMPIEADRREARVNSGQFSLERSKVSRAWGSEVSSGFQPNTANSRQRPSRTALARAGS